MRGSGIMQSTPKTSDAVSFETFNESLRQKLYNFGGIEDDTENREHYRPGGYHPVHLGDTFGENDRYRVIHKLGHGGFATVWLCHDAVTLEYVGLKIIIAIASSENCPELKILRLKDLDFKQPGGDKIVILKDHFWISGPNGNHLCFVLPLLGPQVHTIWYRPYDPGNLARKIALQMVQGMAFLHNNGICHGDFRPRNILLRLSNFEDLSEEQLIETLGEPSLDEVWTVSGEIPGPNAPEYLVREMEFNKIDSRYITDQICIIDFGESYELSSPPEYLGIPEGYRSPELIFDNTIGMASDVWALACTLYETRAGSPLFENFFGTESEIIRQIETVFGTLPEPWKTSWAEQCGKSCEEGEANDTPTDKAPFVKGQVMKKYLGEGYNFVDQTTWQMTGYTIPETEIEVLADLLERMMGYAPDDRMSAKSALEHPWINWEPVEDERHQDREAGHKKEISQNQPENKECEDTKEHPGDRQVEEKHQDQPEDTKREEVEEQPQDNQEDENMPKEQSSNKGGTPDVTEDTQQEGAEELWQNEELFRGNLARLIEETRPRRVRRSHSIELGFLYLRR